MAADIQAIANEIFARIGTGRRLSPFTPRAAGLTPGEKPGRAGCDASNRMKPKR
jgi:hypothetical protein